MSRQHKSTGQVRIVAGQWRGRKLPVADVPGLRPTSDRLRETLFNWLQASIAGSRCLDLFAGTGALGIEALSRYAESVTFVEPNHSAHANICQSLDNLEQSAEVVCATAQSFLSANEQVFDIVFIDPPFEEELQFGILQSLLPKHVRPGGLVYVESPAKQNVPSAWPDGLSIQREKRMGEVQARLFRIDTADE